MTQYLIIARDGTDEDALSRRMKARPFHFEGARKLRDEDNFIIGGAMLNNEGTMIGSMMVVQFETETDLNNWMNQEPYIKGNVWQQYEVIPFRVATL